MHVSLAKFLIILIIELMNNSLTSIQNLLSILFFTFGFFQSLSLRTADDEKWDFRERTTLSFTAKCSAAQYII
jgi:hypothetical protein